MRKTFLGALAMLLAALTWQPVAAAEDPDWVLARLTAGDAGAQVDVLFTGSIAATGPGTLVLGTGFGLEWNGYKGGHVVATTAAGAGGAHVGTGRDRGGLHLSASAPVNLIYDAAGGVAGQLSPGEEMVFAVFVGNGTITDHEIAVETLAGHVTTELDEGTGTVALEVGAQGDDGSAVAVGGIATGSLTRRAVLDTGIAGTIVTSCSACRGTWTPPGGWEHPWQQPPSGDGMPPFRIFAGDAGPWKWTWSGSQMAIDQSSALYGIYFPAGDDWDKFQSGSGS